MCKRKQKNSFFLTFSFSLISLPPLPPSSQIRSCISFVNSLPFLLPCPHCGFDLKSFIQTNDLYEGVDPWNPACKGSQVMT